MLEPLFHSNDSKLYWNSVTRLEFADSLLDKDCNPWFPFGATCAVQHSISTQNMWRVHLLSPFPNKGWLPLKHPIHGWMMTKEQAIQFAREMQP